jgi:hypothetical protein
MDMSDALTAEPARPGGPEIEALDKLYAATRSGAGGPVPKPEEITKAVERVVRVLTAEQVKPGVMIESTPRVLVIGLEKGRHHGNDGTGYVAVLFTSGELRVYRIMKYIAPEPPSEGKPDGVPGNDYVAVDQWTPDGMF